jgi:type I restriction enzyme, S subunit
MKSNRPVIRFPGFSRDWKERKLAEVVHYSNGGSFENEVVNKGKYELITLKSVDIDGNLIPSNKFIDSEVSTLEKDTLVMILSEQAPGLLGKTSVIPLNKYYVLNQRVASLTPKEESDSNFLTKAINRNGKYFSSRGAGTKVQNISKPNVENFEFFIPELKEQIKIGSFFKMLDNIIYLHQQELTTLKQTKLGFLQKMFPKEGESVPEVRFPGFTGDWEQSTLEDVANYRRGSFPQPYGNKEWYDEEYGMPFVQVVDVGENLKLVDNTKQKISELAQPKSVFVEAGKVIVTLQGSIGRVAITQYSSYVDRTLLIFEKYKVPINTYYFAYVIQQLFNKEKQKAPGGTIKTITKEALSAFLISLPNLEEQIKIGNFFKQLDDIITLHQRELDSLKETKKAFLQKMFV